MQSDREALNTEALGTHTFTAPTVLPSPKVTGSNGWSAAVTKARAFVDDLTVEEMVNVRVVLSSGS